jgi:hypothetical protein
LRGESRFAAPGNRLLQQNLPLARPETAWEKVRQSTSGE